MAWSWEFAQQAFRSLGGTIDNIARKDGSSGRGLIPIDPDERVRLHAPEGLFLPIADVEFVAGRLKVKDGSRIGNAERAFFENYSDNFSWGGGGRAEAIAFIAALDNLPDDVRALLSASFGLQPLLEGGDERAEQWFLDSRRMGWRGEAVLVPFLEMLNHAPSATPCNEQDGLSIVGTFPEEILVQRVQTDPFGVFRRFGLISAEPRAFSLPLTLKTETLPILVARLVNFNSILGAFPVPQFERDGNGLNFSCVMIGDATYPRLSRGIFYRVMRDCGQPKAETLFDRIVHENRMMFLKLLATLEPHDGGLIPTLRKVVRHQLEAMSWCVGTREL